MQIVKNNNDVTYKTEANETFFMKKLEEGWRLLK